MAASVAVATVLARLSLASLIILVARRKIKCILTSSKR